jgi:ATPase subunit of ABC transporter with duplicated ATPase domains
VVQSLGPKSTRITIDSVFVENSHHHTHLSDGTVENAEFLAISDNLKSLEEEQAKKLRDAAFAKQQAKLETLQSTLEAEERQLKEVTAKQQELQAKIRSVQGGKQVRVKVAADLKAEPYTDAKTVQALTGGDALTILWQTRSWYQVQTTIGTTGWVYALLVESEP